MKLIKPKQISGEIMTLLDEADKKVVIVSPYAQAKNWIKLQNTFENLNKRNIPIEFYYRKGEYKTQKEIESLNIEAIPVEKLHCKIYMNEKTAIVSSMNLYEFSDNNSLDIAHKTETKKEYKELKLFYKRYIKKYNRSILEIDNYMPSLYEELNINLLGRCYSKYFENEIQLSYKSSRYNFRINEFNQLELWGILSGNQFEYLSNNKNLIENKNLVFIAKKGKDNRYDSISSEIQLESKTLDKIFESEYEIIYNAILDFLNTVDNIKKETYNKRYH